VSIRLSVITTRTGDDGSTGLGDGSRVQKDCARVQAMGDVDELNSQLGALLSEPLPELVSQTLQPVQHILFDLGSELAIPGYKLMKVEQVAYLDDKIQSLNKDLPALTEFILPGGTRQASLAHIARSVCRRAERSVIAVHHETPLGDLPMQYLNRLSDLLFIIARVLNKQAGQADSLWKRIE
jgi:cob(I)alamin adenosyltransferase